MRKVTITPEKSKVAYAQNNKKQVIGQLGRNTKLKQWWQ